MLVLEPTESIHAHTVLLATRAWQHTYNSSTRDWGGSCSSRPVGIIPNLNSSWAPGSELGLAACSSSICFLNRCSRSTGVESIKFQGRALVLGVHLTQSALQLFHPGSLGHLPWPSSGFGELAFLTQLHAPLAGPHPIALQLACPALVAGKPLEFDGIGYVGHGQLGSHSDGVVMGLF